MNPAEVVLGGVAIGLVIVALVVLALVVHDFRKGRLKDKDRPPEN